MHVEFGTWNNSLGLLIGVDRNSKYQCASVFSGKDQYLCLFSILHTLQTIHWVNAFQGADSLNVFHIFGGLRWINK